MNINLSTEKLKQDWCTGSREEGGWVNTREIQYDGSVMLLTCTLLLH